MALDSTLFVAYGGTSPVSYTITVEDSGVTNGMFDAFVDVERDGTGAIIQRFDASATVNGTSVDVSQSGPLSNAGNVTIPASPGDSVVLALDPDWPDTPTQELSFTVPRSAPAPTPAPDQGQGAADEETGQGGQNEEETEETVQPFEVSDITEVACTVDAAAEMDVPVGTTVDVPVTVTFRNDGNVSGGFSVGAVWDEADSAPVKYDGNASSERMQLDPGEEQTVELRFERTLQDGESPLEADVGYHIYDPERIE